MLLNTAGSILNGWRAYTILILDHRAGMPSTPILCRGATVLVHILELHADEIEPRVTNQTCWNCPPSLGAATLTGPNWHEFWPVQGMRCRKANSPGKHGVLPLGSHLAALVNYWGEVAKLNWYTEPLTKNWKYFCTGLAMEMCRYASRMSMDTVHLLSLMDNLTDAWVSILNCGMTRWWFKQERSIIGHRTPVFCATRKEMAEETLGFWMEQWLKLPLWTRACSLLSASPGVYSWCWRRWVCESVEVVIPTPSWLSPSVHDAQHSPSRLCHCGAKAVPLWGKGCHVSPHLLHFDENITSAIVP